MVTEMLPAQFQGHSAGARAGATVMKVKVLAGLTEVFLNAFQITRPKPERQKQAERIIGSLMLLTLFAVLALIAGMLVWAFHA